MAITVALVCCLVALAAVLLHFRSTRTLKRVECQLAALLTDRGCEPKPAVTAKKPNRWWLQYRLRTLLIVFVVLGVGLAWFARQWQAARRQEAAVTALEQLGSNVQIAYNFEMGSGGCFPEDPDPPAPEWLREWLGVDFFAQVRGVELGSEFEPLAGPWAIDGLDRVEVTDDDLAHFDYLPEVERLSLAWCDVLDEGLNHLLHLEKLNFLSLTGTRITGAGLAKLSSLPNLTELRLKACNIHDQDLAVLSQFPKLRLLDISRTELSNEELVRLLKVVTLDTLDVAETKITNDGLKILGRHPNLRVLRISGPEITDEGLLSLGDFPCLRRLTVVGVTLTPEALKSLQKLDLVELHVSDPLMTTSDQAWIRGSLPRANVSFEFPQTGFFQ